MVRSAGVAEERWQAGPLRRLGGFAIRRLRLHKSG